MERVPEIRLFGTSQSWKHNPQIFQKKYTETYSSGFERPGFGKIGYESQPVFQRSIQRSNSVNQLSSSKPSQSNYYENAIRICEQNQVLNKIKSHNLGYLNVAYLTSNHKQHQKKKPCTLCQAQNITKHLHQDKQQKSINHYHENHQETIKINIQKQQNHLTPHFNNHNVNQAAQRRPKTDHQSLNYMYDNEQKIISNRSNSMFLEQAPVQMHKTSSQVVSFQELTNFPIPIPIPNPSNQANFTGEQFNQLNSNQLRKSNSSRAILQSKCQSFGKKPNLATPVFNNNFLPQNNASKVILQSNCQPLGKNFNKNIKVNPIIQNSLLPQISQLILELNDFGNESDNASYMLRELEDMTDKHLQNRKKCIQKLDDILQKYGNPTNPTSLGNKQTVQPLYLNMWQNSSTYSENMSSPNSKRRNKIF